VSEATIEERPGAPRRSAVANSVRDVLKYRELLMLLVARDLKVRYKRSSVGMLWTLLNPLLQMIVYTLVFSTIMRIGIEGYPVFLLSGLLPWTLVSVGSVSASMSLLGNQSLIRKVAVPQAVYPLAAVGSKLTDAVLSLPALALLAVALGRPPGVSWLVVPLAFVLATAFTTGLALLFSSLSVFFRDVRHLIDVLFQIWFYVTPVIYPASFLEGLHPVLRTALGLNPASPIVRVFQMSIYEGRIPPASTLGLAVLAAATSLAIGGTFFVRSEHRHIHNF
jgi:lipopolysaccharide transport system permease protein